MRTHLVRSVDEQDAEGDVNHRYHGRPTPESLHDNPAAVLIGNDKKSRVRTNLIAGLAGGPAGLATGLDAAARAAKDAEEAEDEAEVADDEGARTERAPAAAAFEHVHLWCGGR